MSWSELINLFAISLNDNWQLVIQISPFLIILFLLLLAVILFLRKKNFGFWNKYEVVEGEIPIPGLGKVKIKPNNDTIRIAYQAWTELITRKVALPLEEENDVIIEIYNSWYTTFGILRELAKNITAQKLRHDPDTKKLVDVMIAVLNQGLRPHLTKWQARFRHWYNNETEKNKERPPQEVQRDFPEYQCLIDDMKTVNNIMLKYADWLHKIFEG